MTSQDRSSVERRWRDLGFSCELWVDGPGVVWADFVHPTDELVMVMSGEVEFEFERRVHRPRLGEELLIPRGVSHTVRNVGGCQAEWLYGYRRAG